MRPFDFIAYWFWAVCLVFGFVNYRRASRQTQARLVADPQRAAMAERLLRRFALLMAVPWLVMGVGVLLGGVPGVWHYFRPQDGNPYVIAWIASVFALSVAFAVWVFACDGAARMTEFGLTGLFGGRGGMPRSPLGIKLMAAAGPFFTLFWIWLVITMNAPVPH